LAELFPQHPIFTGQAVRFRGLSFAFSHIAVLPERRGSVLGRA